MFRGWFTMNEVCPVCGHRFTRELGFFQGAMYLSYGLGIPTFAALLLSSYVLFGSRIGLLGSILLALPVHLALVPALFRYSRVLWAHLNVGTQPKTD